MRNIDFCFPSWCILEKLGQKSQIHTLLVIFFNLFELSMLASEEGSNLNSILKIQDHVEICMKDAS